MLATEELTDMRATAEQSLPDTCVIYAFSSVSDSRGGTTDSWVAGSLVACRLGIVTAGTNAERELTERIGTAEAWMLSFPVSVSVPSSARITHNGARGFEVALPLGPRSYEVLRRVAVTELT